MAINEACQVWIEQRIDEALEDDGKSLRAIGREISAEIERIFQTKIDPETIRSKARRKSGSFDPPKGGDATARFKRKYKAFLKEVQAARSANWQEVDYVMACDMIGDLNNYISEEPK